MEKNKTCHLRSKKFLFYISHFTFHRDYIVNTELPILPVPAVFIPADLELYVTLALNNIKVLGTTKIHGGI